MMRKIFQCLSVILLTGVATTYAGYCNAGEGCCPLTGLGKRSCNGTGTSDCADYLGYTFQGKTQYIITGTCNGFYFVRNMVYGWQKGVQATAYFSTLLAYLLQYPDKKDPSKYTLYCIDISGCPTLTIIKRDTEECFTGSDLPKSVAYNVVDTVCPARYCTRCQIVKANYFPDETSFALSGLRQTIFSSLSGLSSFDYISMGCGCDRSSNPEYAAREYDLQIERATCGKYTFKQRGYVSGSQYACVDKTGLLPFGTLLSNSKYNVTENINKPGGFCDFSQMIADYIAAARLSCYLGFTVYSIVQKPYKFIIRFPVYFPAYINYEAYQPLFDELC